MKNKKNKENLHICTQDEIAEIYYSDERKVFVDTGIDEFVALYKDVPDIIVAFNRKLRSVDLKIYKTVAYSIFKSDDFPSKKVGKNYQVCLVAYLMWKVKKDL